MWMQKNTSPYLARIRKTPSVPQKRHPNPAWPVRSASLEARDISHDGTNVKHNRVLSVYIISITIYQVILYQINSVYHKLICLSYRVSRCLITSSYAQYSQLLDMLSCAYSCNSAEHCVVLWEKCDKHCPMCCKERK